MKKFLARAVVALCFSFLLSHVSLAYVPPLNDAELGELRHVDADSPHDDHEPLVALLSELTNGYFDPGPPTSHIASVVGKFTMPGTLRSTRLVVTSWREGRRIERVPVTRDDFYRFQRGDAVEVKMQEGVVGIPWVYDVSRR